MSHAAVERDVQTPTASTCNKVPIRLQTGRSEERVIEIHLGASVATILEVVAAERPPAARGSNRSSAADDRRPAESTEGNPSWVRSG